MSTQDTIVQLVAYLHHVTATRWPRSLRSEEAPGAICPRLLRARSLGSGVSPRLRPPLRSLRERSAPGLDGPCPSDPGFSGGRLPPLRHDLPPRSLKVRGAPGLVGPRPNDQVLSGSRLSPFFHDRPLHVLRTCSAPGPVGPCPSGPGILGSGLSPWQDPPLAALRATSARGGNEVTIAALGFAPFRPVLHPSVTWRPVLQWPPAA